VVSHAWPLGSLGPEPTIGSTTLGTISVLAFFGLSGFLIAGSAERLPTGRFLWHRFLRLVPGFYVCLVVIAAVIAPVAWIAVRGTLAGYPAGDAVFYVVKNLGLKAGFAPTIDGTQEIIPSPFRAWNGASWSLFYEALFYVVMAFLAARGLLRPRVLVPLCTAATLLLLGWEVMPGPFEAVLFRHHDVYRLVSTGCLFSTGALLWLVRDRVALRWWFALGSAVTTGVGLVLLEHPEWLVALPLVYVLLWSSLRLPAVATTLRSDVSFGVYVYGFPVAALLTVLGANELGSAGYLVVTFLVLLPIAFASWHLVEKPVLRAKNVRWRKRSVPFSGRHAARD
jgi:peptidoglycan/LPS O-acetylase OafA/YrhL